MVHRLVSQFKLPCSSYKINSDKCSSWCLGKLSKLPLSSTHHRSSSRPLELIHSNVLGLTSIYSFFDHKYFGAMVENNLIAQLNNFNLIRVENLDYYINIFRLIVLFIELCDLILMNKMTLLKKNFEILLIYGLLCWDIVGTPFKYWQFAFETAIFLIKRMPVTSLSNKILFQIIFHEQLGYHFSCVFLDVWFIHFLDHIMNTNFFFTSNSVFLWVILHSILVIDVWTRW